MDVFHLIEGVTTIGAGIGWLVAYRAYHDEHQRATALDRQLDNCDEYMDRDFISLDQARTRITELIGQVDRLTEERDAAAVLSIRLSKVLDKVESEINLGFEELEKDFLQDEAEDETDLDSQGTDESAEGETPCRCHESYIFLHADGGSDVRA